LLTAARLASRGHHVIATMRNLNKQGALIEEVHLRGGKVEVMRLDVTDRDSIAAVVREIGAQYGYLDVLVNNAGFGMGGFFEDLSDEDIREQLEVNYFGVLNVTRAVIPYMRQKRSGKIINISSVAGTYASPAFSAYNASKWALEAFSESLRHELKFFGIQVLLVEPGTYRTQIFDDNARKAKNFYNENSPYFGLSKFLEKRVRDYVEDCHKDPEDVAALIEKLVNSKNPPFRNIPDIESQCLYFLRRLLPFSLFETLIRKAIFSKLAPEQFPVNKA